MGTHLSHFPTWLPRLGAVASERGVVQQHLPYVQPAALALTPSHHSQRLSNEAQSVRKMPSQRILIVGAGLSGLVCAKKLLSFTSSSPLQIEVIVLDARDRCGGRMLSQNEVDLGPAWTWPEHDKQLGALLREMRVEIDPQPARGVALSQSASGDVQSIGSDVGPAGEGGFRLRGGTSSLVEKLTAHISGQGGKLILQQRVEAVIETASGVEVKMIDMKEGGACTEMKVDALVLALPCRLIASSINFTPKLPENRMLTMLATPIWMSDTGKVAFFYKDDWWKKKGLSGTAFSDKGPLRQCWDNSGMVDTIDHGGKGTDLHKSKFHAIAGFVFGEKDLAYLDSIESVKKSPIIDQMAEIFGEEARNYTKIICKAWINDENTNTCDDDGIRKNYVIPFGHPLVSTKLGERVIFAGTESVANENGHMEGAVIGGMRAAEELLNLTCEGWPVFRTS